MIGHICGHPLHLMLDLTYYCMYNFVYLVGLRIPLKTWWECRKASVKACVFDGKTQPHSHILEK